LIERLAFDVFHGHVKQAIDFAGVVDGDDVGMVEHTGQAGLVAKARQQLVALRPLHVQAHGFERDRAADGRVQGLVHYAHGAPAELANYLIAPDFFQSHSCAHMASNQRLGVKPAWDSAAKRRYSTLMQRHLPALTKRYLPRGESLA